MTASVANTPENIQAMKLLYKWTYEDHLLPSSAENASFSTASGYAGSVPQLFNDGRIALMWQGRHLIIQFREFDKIRSRQQAADGFDGCRTAPRDLSQYERAHPRCGFIPGEAQGSGGCIFKRFWRRRNTICRSSAMAIRCRRIRLYENLRIYQAARSSNEWDVHAAFAYAAESLGVFGRV